jgi:fumarylacetoacetase
MIPLDHTHDPTRSSWVDSARAPGTSFPLQNLPFGVLQRGGASRIGIGIGDQVLDVGGAAADGLLGGHWSDGAARALTAPDLTALLTWTPAERLALRHALHDLLHDAAAASVRRRATVHLAPTADVSMLRPWRPTDFVDCFASRHHAENVAAVVPGARVPPTFEHLPLGYHGRASTVVVSGTPVRRPFGQRRARTGFATGASRRLDFEAELGLVVGPTHAGGPLAPSAAATHVFGVCLLNDWSARDLQALESEPLGPFVSKAFRTSIGPWVVTAEALAPFAGPPTARARNVPAYLHDDDDARQGALAITVAASLRASGASGAVLLAANDAATLAWTPGQLLAHLASSGAGLPAGLLVGTGTISGPGPDRGGSLVERSHAGRAPIDLGGGVTRTFLEDGDEMILAATCEAPGAARIGFGDCRGVIVAALEP